MASSRLPLAALALITALSGLIRLRQARESLWLDELHTAWCATGPLAEVATRAAAGNQSPLFFWLEWLLVQALGPSELALRLPSLVTGTALGVALYVVASRWTGQPWLGVLAAWLVAVEPRQIFYATEARPYALVELLAVVHMALFMRVIERPTLRARVLLVLGAVLLFHLHYTALLLVPAQIACYLLFRAMGRQPLGYDGRSLALDLFLMMAFCLPAFGNLQAIFARRTNWAAFVPQMPATEILALWPLTLVAVLPLMNADWFVRRVGASGRELPPLAVLLWALVPVSLAWLATESDTARVLFPRYVIVSAPAATLLAVMCLRLAPWRSLQIVLGLGIALLALRHSQIIEQYRTRGQFIDHRRDDWRAAIAHFNAQPGRDRYPVLVRTSLIEADGLRSFHNRALVDYCLYPVTSLYPIDARRQRLVPLPRSRPGQLDADVRERIRNSGGAWLILGGSPVSAHAIQANIITGLGAQGSGAGGRKQWRVARSASFGNVRVVLLRPDK